MNRIYLTVDVECHNFSKKNLYIDGKVKGDFWGIKKILEVGDSANIPINFFIDISEAFRYGDDYLLSIINLIKEHHQQICMHLHPNFISGDDNRPFIWQYSYEEKKTIFKKALDKYIQLVKEVPPAFRIGCYAMDNEMYEVISEQINWQIVDLSYSYSYGACHARFNSINAETKYDDRIIVLPNTRYLGFSFFGKKQYVNLDITSSNFNEMKRVIDINALSNITCTMHSWNLFKHLFYNDKTIRADKHNLRKMFRFIKTAKQNNYIFERFDNYEFVGTSCKEKEIKTNKGFYGFIMSFFNTFSRMQRAGRVNKKYFVLYSIFYGVIALLFLALIVFVVLRIG